MCPDYKRTFRYKLLSFLGRCIGFFLYYGFYFWKDLVSYFIYMVRSENFDRWQKIDEEVVRYQKSHLDDIRLLKGENFDGNN